MEKGLIPNVSAVLRSAVSMSLFRFLKMAGLSLLLRFAVWSRWKLLFQRGALFGEVCVRIGDELLESIDIMTEEYVARRSTRDYFFLIVRSYDILLRRAVFGL